MINWLFKGKRTDNNEWLESNSINVQADIFGKIHVYMGIPVKCGNHPNSYYIEWVEVIPESVKRSIGLKDKNGKNIFEGDILRHYNDKQHPESYYTDYIVYDNVRARFCFAKDIGMCFTLHEDCTYEIVGNTYDNPEMVGIKTIRLKPTSTDIAEVCCPVCGKKGTLASRQYGDFGIRDEYRVSCSECDFVSKSQSDCLKTVVYEFLEKEYDNVKNTFSELSTETTKSFVNDYTNQIYKDKENKNGY